MVQANWLGETRVPHIPQFSKLQFVLFPSKTEWPHFHIEKIKIPINFDFFRNVIFTRGILRRVISKFGVFWGGVFWGSTKFTRRNLNLSQFYLKIPYCPAESCSGGVYLCGYFKLEVKGFRKMHLNSKWGASFWTPLPHGVHLSETPFILIKSGQNYE